MNTTSSERDRLNRRIRGLSKEVARDRKHFRNRISRQGAAARRGVSMQFVPRGDSGFFEPSDVISLCHEFLDKQGIAADYIVTDSSALHR